MVNVDKILDAVGWGLLIVLSIPIAAFITALYGGIILIQTWRDLVKKNWRHYSKQ